MLPPLHSRTRPAGYARPHCCTAPTSVVAQHSGQTGHALGKASPPVRPGDKPFSQVPKLNLKPKEPAQESVRVSAARSKLIHMQVLYSSRRSTARGDSSGRGGNEERVSHVIALFAICGAGPLSSAAVKVLCSSRLATPRSSRRAPDVSEKEDERVMLTLNRLAHKAHTPARPCEPRVAPLHAPLHAWQPRFFERVLATVCVSSANQGCETHLSCLGSSIYSSCADFAICLSCV